MKKNMTCIVCPIGCQLEAEYEMSDGKPVNISVSGNTCPRGAHYAKEELISPERTLTTTMRTEGGKTPLVPVRTSGPIPKNRLFDAMKEVNARKVSLPIKCGDVIIGDFISAGVDLIASADAE